MRYIITYHASNRHVYMTSTKETLYFKTNCMFVAYILKNYSIHLNTISKIVFRDIRKYYRQNILNHVKHNIPITIVKSNP